jgi:hypothetical protein
MKWEGIMPMNIKITTELLYQAALAFALMDMVFIRLLVWRIKKKASSS